MDALNEAINNDDLASGKKILAANPELLSRLGGNDSPPLQSAIQNDKIAWVQLLLDGGEDPNYAGYGNQTTPLTDAIMNGDESNWKTMADLLLAKGALIDVPDMQGQTTLLHLLATGNNGQVDKVKYLLDKGADVTVRDRQGMNAADYAITSQSTDLFQSILAKSDINSRDAEGDTLLQLAVQRGNEPIIQILLAKGIDINGRNNDGETALHMAARARSPLIKVLLDAGANPNLPDFKGDLPLHLALRGNSSGPQFERQIGVMPPWPRLNLTFNGQPGGVPEDSAILAPLTEKSDINAKDGFGMTPLLISVLARDQQARDLISDRTPQMDSTTALFDAVSQENADKIGASLIQKPYLVDFRAPDGSTPLHVAARWGTLGAATALVQKGADVNARDSLGRTPLIRCLTDATGLFLHRAKAMEAFLIAHGADINAADITSDTALREAVRSGDMELVTPLLDGGARVDPVSQFGKTPLMEAIAGRADSHIIDALLAKGAWVNVQEQDGWSPLMLAVESGNKSLVQELLTKGADVNHRNQQGVSVLGIVLNSNGNGANTFELAALLIQNGADPAEKGNGQTLLGRVVESGSETAPDLVKLLLATKKFDVNVHDSQGTYLIEAINSGKQDLVQILLDAGADPNDGSDDGTPLAIAKQGANQAIVAMLVAKGAK